MSAKKNKIPKVGDNYEIPVEGSLALFALGYRGVQAWRKVRNEAIREEKKNLSDSSENKGK